MIGGAKPRPSLFEGMSEVQDVLRADVGGRVLDGGAGPGDEAERRAALAARIAGEFSQSGGDAGLAQLRVVLVKSPRKVTLTALRGESLLIVSVDPSKATAAVEKALHAWVSQAGEAGARASAEPPPPAPAAAMSAAPPAWPSSQPQALSAASLPADPAQPAAGHAAVALPAPQGAAPEAPRSPPQGSSSADAWFALRRALVRGQLTEASARQRDLDAIAPSAAAARPGCERLEPAERDRAMRVLLDGIGSIILGDGVGGGRTLRELADASTRNMSVRWLALQWSAWAAIRSGSFAPAKSHLKDALLLARQLDIHARAVTQWTAAEVLAHDGDTAKALSWVSEARARFERLADRWGIGRTLLTEARILVSIGRDQEAAEAARKACEVEPGWEEPPIFMARRALMRGAGGEAEEIVRAIETPAADRVRALIEASREGAVSQAELSEFLREHEAPPSAHAVQALERMAAASPGFLQARETLAWMLLKLGRYADASAIFRALLTRQLSPADRASVMLGLGCIAHAQQVGSESAQAGGADAAHGRTGTDGRSTRANEKGGAPSPVFSGQLSVFALPDLLEFLRSTRRTGLLVCSSAAGMGALRFRQGSIVGADSPAVPDVGELLLRAGKISADALEGVEARRPAGQSDHDLGEMLAREGIVDAASVQQALAQGVGLTIRDLVQWKDGDFAFNPEGDGEAPEAQISVELDAQALLLNVFKEMDEAARDAASAGDRLRP
jgi:hypothetical protein